MHIVHVAIRVENLELMKEFYRRYFRGTTGIHYKNESKGFESCFITFENGARIELMKMSPHNTPFDTAIHLGFAHIAFAVGKRNDVDELTSLMRNDGVEIISDPRTTGDGYYESVVADPEGNLIEITIG